MATPKHIVFGKATGTGTQTISTVGFHGTAAIFWTTKQTATGIATDLRWCIGLTDGTAQVCKQSTWPDASASPTGGQAESQSTVIEFRSIDGSTQVASATFGGFTADGFTLDWTVNDGSADLIHALVIHCSDASLVSVPTTGTAGGDVQDVTVGFQPDAIVWLAGDSTDGLPYTWSQSYISFQAHGLSQPSTGANHLSRLLTMNTGAPSHESDDEAIRVPYYTSIFVGFVNEALEVTSAITDGFRLTNGASFGVVNHTHFALCLSGVPDVAVGQVIPGATGDITVSLGFRPSAILMSSDEGSAGPPSVCVGAWDEDGQSVATVAADFSGSTIAVRRETADAIVRTLTPSAGGASTDHLVAEIASVDDDGFTLHVTSYGGLSPQIGYMAIGASSVPSSRNLLTGSSHTVQGSDNLIAGANGTVTGDTNALFALSADSPAPEIVGDRTFKVVADAIDLEATTIEANGLPVATVTGTPSTGALAQFADADTVAEMMADDASTFLDGASDPFIRTSAGSVGALDDLTDVAITAVADGDVLTYDSGSPSGWKNAPPTTGGGGGALDDLSDVTITSVADGDVLTYDSGSPSGWKNAAPTGGGGGLVLLEQHTASSSATLDFTSFISSTYDDYVIRGTDIVCANNGTDLYLRMGTGGGPTYDSSGNYYGGITGWTNAGAFTYTGSADSGMVIVRTLTNHADYGVATFELKFSNPNNSSRNKNAHGTAAWHTGSVAVGAALGWLWNVNTVVTAVRFLMSSGNIASGTIRIYGVEK